MIVITSKASSIFSHIGRWKTIWSLSVFATPHFDDKVNVGSLEQDFIPRPDEFRA